VTDGEEYTLADEIVARARIHAREVVDEYELAVNLEALEWEVSMRARRRAGRVAGTPTARWRRSCSLGRPTRPTRWPAFAEIVRHELVHAWGVPALRRVRTRLAVSRAGHGARGPALLRGVHRAPLRPPVSHGRLRLAREAPPRLEAGEVARSVSVWGLHRCARGRTRGQRPNVDDRERLRRRESGARRRLVVRRDAPILDLNYATASVATPGVGMKGAFRGID